MNMYGIASLFGVNDISDISKLDGGHINRTFLVTAASGKFVLQALNREVFRSPEDVMGNIAAIEGAFKRLADSRFAVPEFLRADEKNFVAVNNEVWRMYRYGETAVGCTPEGVHDRGFVTGLAFGTFIRTTAAANVVPKTVIEGFHDFGGYRRTLASLAPVKAEGFRAVGELLENVFGADMPKRCVHNDAKSANVIIGSEKCTIIDLDTTMIGYAALDYGDIVRSFCTSAPLDLGLVRNITEGFAEGLDGLLKENEVDSLYFGILWTVGELTMRYLIDGIGGNGYFKGKTPEGCIKRADELTAQFEMFTHHEKDIRTMISDVFGAKNLQ